MFCFVCVCVLLLTLTLALHFPPHHCPLSSMPAPLLVPLQQSEQCQQQRLPVQRLPFPFPQLTLPLPQLPPGPAGTREAVQRVLP